MNHIYILCFPFGRFRPFSAGKWFPFGPVYLSKLGPNGKFLTARTDRLNVREKYQIPYGNPNEINRQFQSRARHPSGTDKGAALHS